ncbi:heme ABC exporter ATP-binding protein CcmA [Lichenicoccus roseus]
MNLPAGETSAAAGLPPSGLQASGLVVFRGERLVLDGVDLQCAPGGAVLLTGPNGAGKSTLLRVLAGLRAADAGSLSWNGIPVADDLLAHAGRVAYLGHQDALKPGLTLEENLQLACILGGGDLEAALAAVDLVPLRQVPARLLSAGQKRRAALARVLLLQAAIWLLDEPSLGLDRHAVGLLGELLSRHRAAGGLAVATTHVPLPLPDAAILALETVVTQDVLEPLA